MSDFRCVISGGAVLRETCKWIFVPALAIAAAGWIPFPVHAQAPSYSQEQSADCSAVPDHQRVTQALREVVAPGDPEANGGLGNHMWAVVVNRGGVICTVAHSGETFGDQWLGSRPIAAEKAYTAIAFSLPGFAFSTANLYWPSQPENSLYALATSNPVHEEAFYVGEASSWGTADDPVVGRRVGGTVVFGGGLALYTGEGELVGGLGLSGDESCTDHVIAWKVRHALNLDSVPAGVTKANDDNIVHDLSVDPGTACRAPADMVTRPAARERRRSPNSCPIARPPTRRSRIEPHPSGVQDEGGAATTARLGRPTQREEHFGVSSGCTGVSSASRKNGAPRREGKFAPRHGSASLVPVSGAGRAAHQPKGAGAGPPV